MDLIYQELLIAREEGYSAIDISNNEIVFTDIDDRYKDYGFIIIGDMYIYDKYGDKIDEYNLWELPGARRGAFSLKSVSRYSTIDVYPRMKFYPMQLALTKMTQFVTIHNPANIYIPAWVFEGIVAPKITLSKPILDDDILRAIHCYDVTIITRKKYPSFEPLECTIFKLIYSPDNNVAPIMPKSATNVTLEVRDYNPHFGDFYFGDNDTIQELKVKFYNDAGNATHLGKLPLLRKLSIPVISTLVMNIKTFWQLETLLLPRHKVNIFVKGDEIYITNREYIGEDAALYGKAVPNVTKLRAYFYNNDQFILFSNVKSLTVYESIDVKYIPPEIEKFRYKTTSQFKKRNTIDELKKMQKYLLSLDSIKSMPLILFADESSDLSFDTRHNVYYDIYVYDTQKNEIYKVEPKSYVVKKFENRVPDLRQALLHNARYTKRSRTLLLLSEESKK